MSNPQAYITVRKSRLRTEPNNTVYLEKNVEFEIELYNPTSDRVGALITINGKAFSHKFILRPGERAFIERYLDEAKKFLFDTYFVDGSSETKQAIKNNGGISVAFFRERPAPVYTPPVINHLLHFSSQPLYRNHQPLYSDVYSTCSGSTQQDFNISSNLSNTSGNTTYTSSYSGQGSMDFMDMELSRSVSDNSGEQYKSKLSKNTLRSKGMDFEKKSTIDYAPQSAPVETGRVEKGGFSNQTFGSTNIDLEYWAFHTVTLKLLPVSQRPEEAVAYCSNCGRRSRAKENFCPKCGTKH